MVPVSSGPERKCIPIDLIDPLNFPTLPTMMSTLDIDNGKHTTLTTATTTTDNNERAPTTMNNDENNNDACNNDDDDHDKQTSITKTKLAGPGEFSRVESN